MKAKHFKRLRRRIGRLQTFTIKETYGLFGDFYSFNFRGTKVSASSYERALQIYMRNYRKKHKQKHNYERSSYTETIEKWGRLMVISESGFKRFY